MTPRQKLQLMQLQIAIAGMIILLFGLWWDRTELMIFGSCIVIYGMIRYRMIPRLLKDEEDAGGETLDSIIEEAKRKEEQDSHKEEGSKKALTAASASSSDVDALDPIQHPDLASSDSYIAESKRDDEGLLDQKQDNLKKENSSESSSQ